VRILSTGDWHFNAGYDEDIEASVSQIINRLKRGWSVGPQIDLVVNTGDVYERSSEPRSRNIAAELIRDIAEWATVLIVRGNHDAPGDLDILSKIRSKHPIWVHSIPNVLNICGISIHTLPWLTKARWQSLHPEASKEEGDATVSQLLLEYMRNDILLRSDTKKHILVGHCLVAGARAQNHQQMGADGVTVGEFDLKDIGFDAALLGHIHLKQTFGQSESFLYNGSVAALEYGETPDKYYSILNTDDMYVEWVKLQTIHRQDINAYWTPTGLEIEDLRPALIEGARIRANLRISGGDNINLAKKQLEELLVKHGALEYQISPQVIPVSKVRAVEISSTQSLYDKLELYWKATGTEPEVNIQRQMREQLSELEDECDL